MKISLSSRSKEGGKCQLAILHPMKLSIYALHTTEGHALHGSKMFFFFYL